jgi:hypothetical protein
MNTKTIAIVAVVIFLLASIGVGVYLAMNPQDFLPSAQESTQTQTAQGGSCPAPGTPATVTLSYPLCESVGGGPETCVFEKAGCVWEGVSGATKYSVKVTEVETGASVSSETINAPALKTSFPVVQGRTYKCEVSAINSCGATGGINEDTLLCETDAFVSPAPVSTPPPAPVSTPTPTPTPSPIACGFQGCSTAVPCQNGFICVETSAGQNFCARSEYQSMCYKSPGVASCCEAPPAPKPTLPPAGALDSTLILGGAGLGLVILGAAALLLL